jgi:hypothetical protein
MKTNNRLFCFSPPVMLATFAIEVGLIIYTVMRYKMTTLTRLAVAMLFFLATFQLAEYFSCGSADHAVWSKIGFLAITALPPLGIHFILTIAKQKKPIITWGAYVAGLVFASMFLLPGAFENHACTGNYVIFKLTPGLGGAYFAYYYGLLISGLVLAIHYGFGVAVAAQRALLYQVFGYLSFLLPTAIVNAVNPVSTEAIPSVMCGFAVIYALTIVFGVLPTAQAPLKRNSKSRASQKPTKQ